MDFDPKGVKWKLKIWSLGWNPICFKKFITSTVKMAAKKDSLHIYGVRYSRYFILWLPVAKLNYMISFWTSGFRLECIFFQAWWFNFKTKEVGKSENKIESYYFGPFGPAPPLFPFGPIGPTGPGIPGGPIVPLPSRPSKPLSPFNP